MITVFSRDGCAPCVMIKKYLTHKNAEFEVKPAEGDEYQQYAEKYGFIVPLVVKGEQGFIGYNPSLVNQFLDSL